MNRTGLAASTIALLVILGCSPSATPPGATQTNSPNSPNGAESSVRQATAPEPVDEQAALDSSGIVLYRDAQALMKEGKSEEGYATAKKAMGQFIEENNNLVWMMLESIEMEGCRIDVHFNMGPEERSSPETGIVRPLSFRIWSTGNESEILETIDFEIGRIGGDDLTAALGKTDQSGHTNYGILPVDASYTAIKEAVIKLANQISGKQE